MCHYDPVAAAQYLPPPALVVVVFLLGTAPGLDLVWLGNALLLGAVLGLALAAVLDRTSPLESSDLFGDFVVGNT